MENLKNMILSEEVRIVISVTNICLIIGAIWAIAKVYFTFKSKVETHDKQIEIHDQQIDNNSKDIIDVKEDHNKIHITQAVLETKLENIEVGIVDIKSMLLTHMNKDN